MTPSNTFNISVLIGALIVSFLVWKGLRYLGRRFPRVFAVAFRNAGIAVVAVALFAAIGDMTRLIEGATFITPQIYIWTTVIWFVVFTVWDIFRRA